MLHRIILYFGRLYATLRFAMLCDANQCYAVLCDATQCYDILLLCYAMLCYAMPCHVILCSVMLRYAMQFYVMLFNAMIYYCYATQCFSMLCDVQWSISLHVANGRKCEVQDDDGCLVLFSYIVYENGTTTFWVNPNKGKGLFHHYRLTSNSTFSSFLILK